MSEHFLPNPRMGISPHSLTLTLCLEEDSILLGEAVLDALGHPRQVQLLINEEQKMLLLQACTVDDREAIVIPPLTMEHFEMSGHSLLRRIRRLTGWTDNYPRVVYGSFIPTHCAIVFDLRTAQLSPLQMPLDGSMPNPS